MSHTVDHKYFIMFVKPNPAVQKSPDYLLYGDAKCRRAMTNIGYKFEIGYLSMHFC